MERGCERPSERSSQRVLTVDLPDVAVPGRPGTGLWGKRLNKRKSFATGDRPNFPALAAKGAGKKSSGAKPADSQSLQPLIALSSSYALAKSIPGMRDPTGISAFGNLSSNHVREWPGKQISRMDIAEPPKGSFRRGQIRVLARQLVVGFPSKFVRKGKNRGHLFGSTSGLLPHRLIKMRRGKNRAQMFGEKSEGLRLTHLVWR